MNCFAAQATALGGHLVVTSAWAGRVRPRRVGGSCRLLQERGGGRIIQRWREPDAGIDGAQAGTIE
jgi:hypothetical protein